MKFSLLALVASVTAAPNLIATDGDTAYQWSVCLKAADCKDSWVCCEAKTDEKDAKLTTSTYICTDPTQHNGIVPTSGGKMAGWSYFCSHEAHKEAAA